MIKKIINRFSKTHTDLTTEQTHINQIVSLEKECWRYNMNQEKIFKEIVKHLNKLKLSPERHPFLVDFRDKANNQIKKYHFNNHETHMLLKSLHEYRNNLKNNPHC